MARRGARSVTCQRPSCERRAVLIGAHERLDEMERLRADGASYRTIAVELELPQSTVYRALTSPREVAHGYCAQHAPAPQCAAGGCPRRTKHDSGYCWQHRDMAETG